MTYVIVQNCCNDASCVDVCPVDCIHPTRDEPDFRTAEMLYINPADCIDCGACVDACPVDAVRADYDLPEHLEEYLAVNEEYFSWMAPPPPATGNPRRARVADQVAPLRVAVVGAGPSGWFVAEELVTSDRADVEVTVLDRLPVSHGLVRHGVAPDHQATKQVGLAFDKIADHQQVQLRLGVDVGSDLSHAELREHFDAVVYCTGAAVGRTLGIPGEDLPGVITSADFVHWYNGHPDHVEAKVELVGERAVIVGNGNVALDIARVLLCPAVDLASTDIADHALEALRDSTIEEVVVLGRRGPEHAAFTSPELRALLSLDGVTVSVQGDVPAEDVVEETAAAFATTQKLRLLRGAVDSDVASGEKRLVLRFDTTPVEVVGVSTRGLRVRESGTEQTEVIEADLVITAIGYRGAAVPGVVFDDERGRFHHEGGRVLDSEDNVVPALYAAGWAKRGPTGVIGTNRVCAAETVAALLDDVVAGGVRPQSRPSDGLDAFLATRSVRHLDAAAWRSLAAAEKLKGREVGRPRVKVLSHAAALAALED